MRKVRFTESEQEVMERQENNIKALEEAMAIEKYAARMSHEMLVHEIEVFEDEWIGKGKLDFRMIERVGVLIENAKRRNSVKAL